MCQNDFRVQPVACASFAKRTAVHVVGGQITWNGRTESNPHIREPASAANDALGRLRTKICLLQTPRQIGFVRRGLKHNFPLGERINSIRDSQRLLD